MTGADCDPTNGTRVCDLSQPGGYCLVDGCDAQSCPEDSVCVRFFPEQYLTKPCDPTASDTGIGGAGGTGCNADELCLWSGLCTRRSSEKRACMQSCESNGDCRGGYECRLTGTRGTMPLTGSSTATPPATGTAGLPRFCAPI